MLDLLFLVDRLPKLVGEPAQLGQQLLINLARLRDFGPQGVERFEESLFVHIGSVSWRTFRRNCRQRSNESVSPRLCRGFAGNIGTVDLTPGRAGGCRVLLRSAPQQKARRAHPRVSGLIRIVVVSLL